jgi:hypothetical protein
MARSNIEIYWNKVETAPEGVIAQVRVTDGAGPDYLLPYPCTLTRVRGPSVDLGPNMRLDFGDRGPRYRTRDRCRDYDDC